MYFKIGPKEKDDKFSYKIVKHPNSEFKKSIGKSDGRKVFGKFDNNAHFYEGYVENDSLIFLDTARKMNMSNYIHTQLSAVCPHNLRAFTLIFDSIIKNKKEESLTEEEFNKKDLFEAVFGPFPCNPATVVSVFNKIDFDAHQNLTDETKMAYMFSISNREPVTTTEFIQKLYIISYYLTTKYTLVKHLSDETIDKFIELSKNWLDKCSMKNSIVNRLCRNSKRLIEKYETNLIESSEEIDEEEKTQKLSKLDEYLNKIGLHEKRHNFILSKISDIYTKSLIDLGSGEGKFLKLLQTEKPNIKVIALEANGLKVERINRKLRSKNIKVIQSNIVYPKLSECDLKPDFLTAIEIIEHLNKEDRQRLINIILNIIMPKEFIITTPNIDYNKLYDIPEGEYRHKDHKIEYNNQILCEEVVLPLMKKYNINILKLFPEEDIDPSFVIYGQYREDINDRNHDQRAFYKIQNMYSPIYLDVPNYEINHRELSNGYSSIQYMNNKDNIFYLAPTMSPVDFDYTTYKYLEHPSACFQYYQERDINELIAEEKYMGSRAYILAFRSIEQAQAMGYKIPIVINSRQGYPFFNNEEDLMRIHSELINGMDKDFIILDCEVMPWAFKAQGMINNEFLIPGECAYLSRKYGKYSNLDNCIKYLSTLDSYSRGSDLEIRPFHIIAEGEIKNNKFHNVTFGFTKSHFWHMLYFQYYENTMFKPVKYHRVNLDSKSSMNNSIEMWEEFCNNNGEGFVYKTIDFINYSKNGYYIQPMLKVRGRDYLRIIYGIDYLDEEYFRKLTFRNTKGKRNQAIQEFDLGMKILRAFLNNNKVMKDKLVAAFIGMENINYSNIDATL